MLNPNSDWSAAMLQTLVFDMIAVLMNFVQSLDARNSGLSACLGGGVDVAWKGKKHLQDRGPKS